jgi:hypothetical protein
MLCGIGFLITFIVGWINNKPWGITNVMLAWTGLWVVGVIFGIIQFATMPAVVVVR